jgi:hypothetical protein
LKVGSGRDGDVDDEDEAIIAEERGKLAAVIFRGQSVESIGKILAPGHFDQEQIFRAVTHCEIVDCVFH